MIVNNGSIEMKGGTLGGSGSTGMAMNPFLLPPHKASCARPIWRLPPMRASQTTCPDSEDTMTFKASEVSQSLVLSTAELVEGSTYTISSGGTTATDLTATTEASSNGMMGGGVAPGGFMK